MNEVRNKLLDKKSIVSSISLLSKLILLTPFGVFVIENERKTVQFLIFHGN
jgi:hypothetical protein